MPPVDDRYQNQPLHVRVWRMRHYIPVPLMALNAMLRHDYRPSTAWRLSLGMAHVRMNWVYTMEELVDSDAKPECGEVVFEYDPGEESQN